MKNLTVIVYPVEKESVQKRHMTPVVSGAKGKLEETGNLKRYFREAGHTPIKFMIDRNTGKYKTGLEEVVTNPLYNLDYQEQKAKYKLSQEWDKNNLLEKVLAKEKIDKQTLYEILDGQDPDTYHNRPMNDMLSFVTGTQEKRQPSSYIEKSEFTLYTQGSNVFTTETSRGRLAIQCVKNQSCVALDKLSINNSVHDWYIGRENEAEHDRAKMESIINDAIFELVSLTKKYPPFDLYRLAIQLEDKQSHLSIAKGELNNDIVVDKINQFIKSKSRVQEENIESFKDKVKEFYEQPELFQIKYMVQQGINSRVLGRKDGQFLWHSQVNGNKAWHAWKNQELFTDAMLQESKNSLEKGNYFVEFEEELKSKGIKTR